MKHLFKMWYEYLKLAVFLWVLAMTCLSRGEPIWEEFWNRSLSQVRLGDAFFLMMILFLLHSWWVKEDKNKNVE